MSAQNVKAESNELVSKLMKENSKLLDRVKELEYQLEKLRSELKEANKSKELNKSNDSNNFKESNKLNNSNESSESNELNRLKEPKKLNEVHSEQEVDNKEKGLALNEYLRYGRQLILPGFGLPGMSLVMNYTHSFSHLTHISII